MDSMRRPRRFDFAFSLSIIWTMFLVVPHSTAIVLVKPLCCAAPSVHGTCWRVHHAVRRLDCKLDI